MKTKQLISILLILTLMLSLCGCGMSKEAKAAQALIDAIGEVSLDSESAIIAAEEAVAALSDKDRERLTGLETLKKAIADGDTVKAFEAAHALKGLTGNVLLTSIFTPVCALSDMLKGHGDMQMGPECHRLASETLEQFERLKNL